MSLSPFSRDDRPLHSSPSSQLARSTSQPNRPPNSSANSPLTLAQALTITAGLAGLIGLLSGSVMRFSLSKSSNARFLSPLQTFPELSDWSSAPAPNVLDSAESGDAWEDNSSDSWSENADLNWETGSDFDEFSSEGFTESPRSSALTLEGKEQLESFSEADTGLTIVSPDNAIAPRTFDAFADRKEGRSRLGEDPLKSLSEGPLLRKNELSLPADGDGFSTEENLFEGSLSDENLSEERF